MPKLKNRLPKMCRDRNQAISWYKGKRIHHGVWNSPEAERNYKRFIARLLENPVLPLQDSKTGDTLVSELAAGFLGYFETRLDKTEFQHCERAIGYLIEIHGELAVNEFSPKKLKVCRNQMVKAGTLCRSQINKHIGRIIRIFAWGVEEEVVEPKTVAALREVKALREGEQGTFDNLPREDVPDEVVLRTLPFLSPTVRAMVLIQRLAGMRPSEVFRMTVGDVDQTRDPEFWYYTPPSHKTKKHIGKKEIPLSKWEQELVAPYLINKKPSEAVFSPRQAVLERRERERERAERKTKISPSQQARDWRRVEKPADRMGEFYDRSSYWRAIQYGILKANRELPDGEKIPHWTPYQLRHAAGTAVEKTEGLDKAQALLGHRTANITKRYAHGQLAIAEEMARKRVNPFEDESI